MNEISSLRLALLASAALLARSSWAQDFPGTQYALAPAVEFDAVYPPSRVVVAAGDMDGDGFGDIVAHRTDNQLVNVFRGQPDQSLAAPITTYCPLPGDPRETELGDFNGDGDLDAATTSISESSKRVYVQLGNGNGTFGDGSGGFALPAFYAIAQSPADLASADFDGDGALDLSCANDNGTGGVSILYGNGAGGFAPEVVVPTGTIDSHAVGDFDGDGDVDIAGTDKFSPVGINLVLGDGAGGFSAPVPVFTGAGTSRVARADVNGDAALDLVASGNQVVTVLVGTGSGSFSAVANPIDAWCSPPGSLGCHFERLDVAELDGDGRDDVVATKIETGSVAVELLSDGAGGLLLGAQHSLGAASGAVSVADLDQDGWDELVTGHAPGLVTVLWGEASGGFAATALLSAPGIPSTLAAGDVSGDGRVDLVLGGGPSGTVTLLLGEGAGSFSYATGVFAGGGAYEPAIADLDGDGDGDVAVAHAQSPGVVTVLTALGGGAFGAPIGHAVGAVPRSIEAADLDGDGRPDLFTANSHVSNTVSVLLASASGGFLPATNYATAETPWCADAGDLDGDGDLDLAVSLFNAGAAGILIGDGTGAFAAPLNVPLGTKPWTLDVGDVDADGDQDFVTANEDHPSKGCALWWGFASGVSYVNLGELTRTVRIGDLDQDGLPDLVTDAFAYRRGTGAGAFGPIVYHVGTGVYPSAFSGLQALDAIVVADLSGDGKLDLASAAYQTPSMKGYVALLLNREPTLVADVPTISLASGGAQHLALDVGDANGGRTYWIFGSTSGSSPGVSLPPFLVPLQVDAYTVFTAVSPNQPPLSASLGLLDGTGSAVAAIQLPAGMPAGLAGLQAWHAGIVLGPLGLEHASNAVVVRLVP